MNSKRSTTPLLKIAALLLLVFFYLYLYTLLHEGGHALVSLLLGGRVTEFNLNFYNLGAHIGVEGNFTPLGELARSVAGAGLPLLVWAACLFVAPRRTNPLGEALKLISTAGILATVLLWAIMPLVYLAGAAPAGDDTTAFIAGLGGSPLWVTLGAAILLAAGLLLARQRITGLRSTLSLLRNSAEDFFTPGALKLVLFMGGAVVAIGLLAGLTGSYRPETPTVTVEIPSGYTLVRQVDLSSQAYEREPLAQFSTSETGQVEFFIEIRNLNTSLLDLFLIGPDGKRHPALHGEGFTTSAYGYPYSKELPAGSYTLYLTSHASPGKLSLYLSPALAYSTPQP